jgi:hypothetical protein
MADELGEDPPPNAKYSNCCQLGHDHIWWKDKSYYNVKGWYLHGWMYLVLCIWCGKNLGDIE